MLKCTSEAVLSRGSRCIFLARVGVTTVLMSSRVSSMHVSAVTKRGGESQNVEGSRERAIRAFSIDSSWITLWGGVREVEGWEGRQSGVWGALRCGFTQVWVHTLKHVHERASRVNRLSKSWQQ